MPRISFSRPLLIAALCTASAAAVAAPMYRWVDKNGVVQYTQTPPPGIQAESVRPAPPPSAGSSGLQRYSEAYSKEQADRASQDAQTAAQQQKRDEACNEAQEQLEKLQSVPLRRLVERDDAGTVTRMTAEKQADLIADAQRAIAKNCSRAP